MITAKEDATRMLPGKTVEPSHRVFETVVAFAAQVEKSAERLEGDGLGVDPWTSHAFELDVCPGNYAGQTETADARAQHVRIFFRIANYQTFVRSMHADLADVSAEGSRAMMVLPVDIVGDGSANGDEARTRRDGGKPSFREKYVDDVGKADSAFATQHASRFVESQHAVETAAIDQLAAGIETRVPITAAKAIGKQRTWRGSSKNCRHL